MTTWLHVMTWITLLAAPIIAAHGGHGHGDEQLIADGQRLMVGEFRGDRPGPLVIVPFHDGPLPCSVGQAGYLVPAGDLSVSFISNATHLRALVAASDAQGFLAAGLGSDEAVRSLLRMQEHAISMYPMVAMVPDGPARHGLLGIPHAQTSDGPGHEGHFEGIEPERALMAYGNTTAEWCQGFDLAIGMDFQRNLTSAWRPGELVHAIIASDAHTQDFVPRALDTTVLSPFNLYLSRPGEDPAVLKRAFSGSLHAGEDFVGLAIMAAIAVTALVALWRQ